MKKKKWLGSLLNFIMPGLGSFYGRDVKKGVLTYLLFLALVFSVRFTAYSFVLFAASVLIIAACYVYVIISGYRSVKTGKEYEPAPFDKWYVYILILFSHWFFISAIKGRALDRITPINFASIPTTAMDPALLKGDILAYKKTKSLERNDVTIFWFPDETETMYVKRCIGLPGDSIQIRNGTVLVNHTPLTGIPLKMKYLVTTDGSQMDARFLKNNRIEAEEVFMLSSDTYQFFLTETQAEELRTLPSIKQVEPLIASEGHEEAMSFYPGSGSFNWNPDFFGPLYIPKKGDRITLTGNNIDLYIKCIRFENEGVEQDDAGIKINGQPITTYEFKENYFFMMGDNRHNSLDSRYWGLLPQSLVIGKALYLYWGETSDRIGMKVM